MPLVIGSLSAFDVLPDEIACEIFQYVYATDYYVVARTSKRFNSIISRYKSRAIFEIARRQFPSIRINKSAYSHYYKVIKNRNIIVSFGISPSIYSSKTEIWMKIGGILRYIHIEVEDIRISNSLYDDIIELMKVYAIDDN